MGKLSSIQPVPVSCSFSGQRPWMVLSPEWDTECGGRSQKIWAWFCPAQANEQQTKHKDEGEKTPVVSRFHKSKMRRQDGVAMEKGGLDTDLVNRGRFLVWTHWIWSDSGKLKLWQVNLEELSHFMYLFCSSYDFFILMMNKVVSPLSQCPFQSTYFGIHVVQVKETMISYWDHHLSPGPHTLWLSG